MDAGRARRLTDAFAEVEALDADERRRYCDALRAGDPELAAELESLLAAHDAPGSLDALAARVLPGLLERLTQSLGERALEHQSGTSRYEVLERIGAGGMGEVYRARDRELDRLVALKFLPWHLAGDADARARLTQEARAASALDHPNVAVVYEIGTTAAGAGTGDGLYIAMAHYDGETLGQKLARGPLLLADAVEYARQAADGLAAAHEAGIVHRDIKPANIMVTERGQVKVLDFGIAKVASADVTYVGSTAGTVAYMSPEQTRGEAVDSRSDVWSLGVVLYEMLAGARPFEEDDGDALLHAICFDAPAPLRSVRADVPTALEAVVERCLRKEPAARYADAGELLPDLRAHSAPSTQHLPQRIRSVMSVSIIALTTLAFAAALLWLVPRRGGDAEGTSAVAQSSAVLRLAVLPLTNLRADTATDHLGYALTDEIIGTLGRIDGVIVRPSAAVRGYHGENMDVATVAGELGVDFLLTGSYLRDGSTLRVNLELANASTGEAAWRESIETEYERAWRLQDVVAERVIRRMGLEWRQGSTTPYEIAAVDPMAYHLYLRSFGYPFVTADGNRSAYDLLKRAVELDSAHAPALTALGYRAFQLGALGFTATPEQSYEEAERAFERALAIDPHQMQALSFQALLHLRAGRLEEALEPLRRALTIQPSGADAWISLGHVYRHAGLLEESVRSFARAAALDPANHRLNLAGVADQYLGRYEQAMQAFLLDPYSPPSLLLQGLLLLESGREEQAEERLRELVAGGQGGPVYGTLAEAVLAHRRGERDHAVRLLTELADYSEEAGSDAEGFYILGRLFVLFGEPATGLRMVKRAVERGFFAYPRFVSDPFLQPIRGDPAFASVMSEAKARHDAFRALVSAEPLPR